MGNSKKRHNNGSSGINGHQKADNLKKMDILSVT